jgi:hypothetical protein
LASVRWCCTIAMASHFSWPRCPRGA